VHFVIGIRGDYLTDLADFAYRLPHIFHNQFRLEPMNREETGAAIREPLRRLRPPRAYQPALLETLLDDLTRGGNRPTSKSCAPVFTKRCVPARRSSPRPTTWPWAKLKASWATTSAAR